MVELPKYKSYKVVHAIKIKSIESDSDRAYKENRKTDYGAYLATDDCACEPIKVSRQYMAKHDPQVGGYYVVYKDGYKSFSPAEAFESGYSRM